MRNKILAVFLCISLVFSFAGCKDQQSQEAAPQNTQSNATAKEKHRSNVIEYDDEIGLDYYLIGDFEDYFECSQV